LASYLTPPDNVTSTNNVLSICSLSPSHAFERGARENVASSRTFSRKQRQRVEKFRRADHAVAPRKRRIGSVERDFERMRMRSREFPSFLLLLLDLSYFSVFGDELINSHRLLLVSSATLPDFGRKKCEIRTPRKFELVTTRITIAIPCAI